MNSGTAWPLRQFYRLTRIPRALWSAWRILARAQGYVRSVRTGRPVDAHGREIPWFTYPAIEYLEQLDLRDKVVFEFGAGNSTTYWARRAARVVTAESDPQWYEQVRAQADPRMELHLVEDPAQYPRLLATHPENFDIIVIDGIERRACCAEAVRKLRRGGLIILDNSDWHDRCAGLLRAAGLLEVDMTGFGPSNGYTWTTSFFFHREFDFPSAHDRQPAHGIGSLPHREEP